MNYRSLNLEKTRGTLHALIRRIEERFPDAAVVSSINELETLTTGLTRKIWQKIIILQGFNPELLPMQPAVGTDTIEGERLVIPAIESPWLGMMKESLDAFADLDGTCVDHYSACYPDCFVPAEYGL